MIQFFLPQYYDDIFYWTLFSICLLTGLYYHDSKSCEKLLKRYSIFLPILLAIIIIVVLGLRPISWYFGDMPLYAHRWNIEDFDLFNSTFDFRGEWFFDFVLITSKQFIPNVQYWFLIVALFYIGCQLWACKRLLWENVWLAILFVFFSFQFYTYCTNGIRNGMACGIMTLSISYFCDRNKIGYFIGVLLFILAIGCHRSIMIPMSALLVSLFIIKDTKYAVYLWLICIVVSFFSGSFFQGFFSSLGFDDRMSSYSSSDESVMMNFSRSGFRWDFLLYSAMPVWLAWYVRSKGIIDQTFTLLANTYIIANSFWVLICRIAFSNRFAYLSWFMYAFVIAYAVIRVPIWKDQDRIAARILWAHSAFTIFMHFLG